MSEIATVTLYIPFVQNWDSNRGSNYVFSTIFSSSKRSFVWSTNVDLSNNIKGISITWCHFCTVIKSCACQNNSMYMEICLQTVYVHYTQIFISMLSRYQQGKKKKLSQHLQSFLVGGGGRGVGGSNPPHKKSL